jgi:Xaa-Pro aminopeptidase
MGEARPTGSVRRDEVRAKLARVRRFLEHAGLDGVLLARRNNFAWLTAGGDNHVASSAAEGPTSLLVTHDTVRVVASTIEMPRILAEELQDLEFEPVAVPWFDNGPKALAALTAHMRVAADTAVGTTPLLGMEFARLRFALMPSEADRYRVLARQAAGVVEEAARAIRPGEIELQVAGRLAAQLLAGGMTPAVLLVAGDERIARFRHPIPTRRPIARQAMLVAVVERGGLHVGLTRLVHCGPLPADLSRRHTAVTAVDAAMAAVSAPGARSCDVLAAGIEAYHLHGFGDEWRRHHQGGPTGYAPREYVATPQNQEPLVEHQPVAWNPSIAGTKSEDTLLVTPDGPEYLTVGHGWPVLEVHAADRVFRRPAILEL